MIVLAPIGDNTRFETAKHLVSYAGLAPGVEQSGTKKRSKPITKDGRKELCWAMPVLRCRSCRSRLASRACQLCLEKRLEELKRRKLPNDAVTVIGRQLMIAV